MEHSTEINNLAAGLAKFRQQVQQPLKTAANPFFKSNYVDLSGVTKAIDDALTDTGLSYIQEVSSEANQISVSTIILHSKGEYLKLAPLAVPVNKKGDAQAFGSAETYARRYSLTAAFGISADVDDDGNAATGKTGHQPAAQPERKQPANAPKQPVSSPERVTYAKLYEEYLTLTDPQTAKQTSLAIMGKIGVSPNEKPTPAQFKQAAHELQTSILEIKDQQRKEA